MKMREISQKDVKKTNGCRSGRFWYAKSKVLVALAHGLVHTFTVGAHVQV